MIPFSPISLLESFSDIIELFSLRPLHTAIKPSFLILFPPKLKVSTIRFSVKNVIISLIPEKVNLFLFLLLPSIVEISKSIMLCWFIKCLKTIFPPTQVIPFEAIFNKIKFFESLITFINILTPVSPKLFLLKFNFAILSLLNKIFEINLIEFNPKKFSDKSTFLFLHLILQ